MSTANITKLLAAADKRNGFPAGTMASVMQQETGGNTKFLQDPTTYHYAAGPDGRRVAAHTGKVSTAFGPFGILESTGKDPGYGVRPLQNKSLDEQVRFASDYLAARSKDAGGLQGGLAGYGEGAKYAAQVAGRIGGVAPAAAVTAARTEPVAFNVAGGGGGGAPVVAPNPVVSEMLPPPVQVTQAPQAPPVAQPSEADAWQAFLKGMPQNRAPVNVADLSYGEMAPPEVVAPQFQYQQAQNSRPNMAAFSSWATPVNARRAALLKSLIG